MGHAVLTRLPTSHKPPRSWQGKLKGRAAEGIRLLFHCWMDVGLHGAVLRELSQSLLSSSLCFPCTSASVRFLSRAGQEGPRTDLGGYTKRQGGRRVVSGWERGQIGEVGG